VRNLTFSRHGERITNRFNGTAANCNRWVSLSAAVLRGPEDTFTSTFRDGFSPGRGDDPGVPEGWEHVGLVGSLFVSLFEPEMPHLDFFDSGNCDVSAKSSQN
jgi:hypothetical protein